MLNKINAIKSELKSDIIDILRGIPDFKITSEHSIDGTLPSCVVYNDEPCDGEMYGKYNCGDKTVYILIDNFFDTGGNTEEDAIFMNIEELISLLELYLDFVYSDFCSKNQDWNWDTHYTKNLGSVYTLSVPIEKYSESEFKALSENFQKYYKIEVETEIHSGYYYIKYNDNSINITL